MRIYWASLEYRFLEGSENFGKFAGGFVYMFVKEVDAQSALPRFLAEAKDNYLEVLEVEFVSIYDEVPWETEEQQRKYDRLAKRADKTDEVILDDLYAYETD